MSYQLRWLQLGNAVLTLVWIVMTASACKLDTSISDTGSAPASQECARTGASCDSGQPTDGTSTDAEPTQPPDGTMTGQSSSGTNGAGNVGGMSGGAKVDAEVPPPPPKKADGETCAGNVDCVSGHCLHEICCTGGDCCRTASDCPNTIIDGQQVACNEPSTCQGKRGEIRCEKFLCIADGDIPDDSACTAEHMAQDCAPYKPALCNGMAEQEEPACPTSCSDDAACLEEAHCDMTSGKCVMDVEDGGACTIGHDCASEHCDNDVCCKEGDCCRSEAQCFFYNMRPMCVNEQTCTGTQMVAVCENSQCASREMPSPTGCNGRMAASCGRYQDVVCDDGVRAQCATSCRVDSQCKADAYCKIEGQGGSGTCELKLLDGAVCTAAAQCQANTCNKGFCCNDSNPDTYCCNVDADCAPLVRRGCGPNADSCDGVSVTATCNSEHVCRPRSTPDANACTDRTIMCPVGYATGTAACPLGCGCNSALDCATGYVCERSSGATRGTCVPDTAGPGPGPGGPGGPAAGAGGGAAGAGGP
jgi:hypothetical protein